jgi:hypothetical protein
MYSPPQQHAADNHQSSEHAAEKEGKNGFWEKAADDPVAYFTLWLVGFTGILAVSTVGLWIATIFLYRGGERGIRMQQGIGMAQTRAYVSIKSAEIYFGGHDAIPFVEIVVFNSGQSPALGFVFSPTVTYLADVPDIDIVYEVDEDIWSKQPGVDIPPGAEHETMYFPLDFSLVEQVSKHREMPSRLGVSVWIDFEFFDVFGHRIADLACFAGVVEKGSSANNIQRHPLNDSDWTCNQMWPTEKGKLWSGVAIQAGSKKKRADEHPSQQDSSEESPGPNHGNLQEGAAPI